MRSPRQHEHPDAEQHPGQGAGGQVRDDRQGDVLRSRTTTRPIPASRRGVPGRRERPIRCLGDDGSVAAYLKFFTRPTQKRLDRTAWLIGQQMHTWLPNLAAAPVLWTDTRHGLHGAKIDFQFAAYLAKAVPGETWLERKSGIADGGTRFPENLRWRCVQDLLLALAVLERAELVHGDLSPNNVVIDLDAPPDDPALYLIDFDAFFAPAAGANRAVTVAEGGTYGTDGYCPPDLAAAASAGDGFRRALLRPLRPRHAAPGILVDGPRSADRRSAGPLEPRATPAAICRLAGPQRSELRSGLGSSGPRRRLRAERARSADLRGDCHRPGPVAPGAPRAAAGHGASSAYTRGSRLPPDHREDEQRQRKTDGCAAASRSAADTGRRRYSAAHTRGTPISTKVEDRTL